MPAALHIYTKSYLLKSWLKPALNVLIDGQTIQRIGWGQHEALEIPQGEHTLTLRRIDDEQVSGTLTFHAEEGDLVAVSCYLDKTAGGLLLVQEKKTNPEQDKAKAERSAFRITVIALIACGILLLAETLIISILKYDILWPKINRLYWLAAGLGMIALGLWAKRRGAWGALLIASAILFFDTYRVRFLMSTMFNHFTMTDWLVVIRLILAVMMVGSIFAAHQAQRKIVETTEEPKTKPFHAIMHPRLRTWHLFVFFILLMLAAMSSLQPYSRPVLKPDQKKMIMIEDNTYRNAFFGIRFTVPEGLAFSGPEVWHSFPEHTDIFACVAAEQRTKGVSCSNVHFTCTRMPGPLPHSPEEWMISMDNLLDDQPIWKLNMGKAMAGHAEMITFRLLSESSDTYTLYVTPRKGYYLCIRVTCTDDADKAALDQLIASIRFDE